MSLASAVGVRNPARAEELVAHGVIRREDACEGKVAFAHRNDARHAAKGAYRKSGHAMAVYKCPFCHQWHLSRVRHGEDES